MQNLILLWLLRGEWWWWWGAECASIFLVGLIVKNGSLLLVFWAGQQSGHNGYLLWDLIGQLAWVKRQWKTFTWDRTQDQDTDTDTRVIQLGQVTILLTHMREHTHTHAHTLELFSQLFLSGCVYLQAVACFSHFQQLCEELRDDDKDIRFMSFQVHHIKYFACANMQVRSCQPCRWKRAKKMSYLLPKGIFLYFFNFIISFPKTILHRCYTKIYRHVRI